MPNHIRRAKDSDIDSIVFLSEKKRIQYQEYQPLFWRKAADSAAKQTPFLKNQVGQNHIIALVYEGRDRIDGFVIANVGRGNQCNIDDFAIADESQWDSIGIALLQEVGRLAKESNCTDYEVVCGHLDQMKRSMLQAAGLQVHRYWFTSAIEAQIALVEEVQIRQAVANDASAIAQLFGQGTEPVGELDNERMFVYVGLVNDKVHGCLMALIVPTPPVYDPEGDTCLVTKFAVKESDDQNKVCQGLLNSIGQLASEKGAVQYVMMCDSSDYHTQTLLTEFGMTIASEWYQGNI